MPLLVYHLDPQVGFPYCRIPCEVWVGVLTCPLRAEERETEYRRARSTDGDNICEDRTQHVA
jgi:hypothetical protein